MPVGRRGIDVQGHLMLDVRTLSIGMLAKIYREDGGEPTGWTPLGSCFPFRRRTHFITAAHCLDGLEPDDVTVLGAFLRSLTPASQFSLHPTADLAVVVFDRLLSEHADIVTPFDSIDPRYGLGTDIVTLGYPIDSLGPRASFPTARMMKGHIQRTVYSETHFGRSTPGEEHQGVELSIYTDAGLSGAPVFRAPASSSVIGMVTGSIESSVRSETIEEFTNETEHYKVIRQDVLRFGLAMTLDRFESWLNEQIPALTDRSD